MTKQSNIIIKQYYCVKKKFKKLTIVKKNNLAELMFLLKIAQLISMLSLISSTNFLFPFAKMVNSSKDGILLQFKRWSRIELSFDCLVFLNVKVDIPICFPDLTFKCIYEDGREGINKSEFKNVLLLGTQESYFIFNVVPYKQKDGVTMG